MSNGPEEYQGKEMTVTLQAPTQDALTQMLTSLDTYAREFAMDEIEVLQQGRDPDGGYRAIVVAHNWNPLAWLSERYHRTGLGIKHGWALGAEQARIKHTIGQEGAVARAGVSEVAIQRAKARGLIAAGEERERTEISEAIAREKARSRLRRGLDIKGNGEPAEDMTKFIFG